MPGIVGFHGAADPQAAAALLDAMVNALGNEDNYLVDRHVGPGAGLARVHLAIVDKAPQPLWSADKNVAIVMTGEIFGWDELPLAEPMSGKEPGFSNVELLLAAYTQYGEDFAEHVNGTFAAAIWDEAEQTLLLVTDMLSSYPLYYAQVGKMLVFGSGARAVAQAPGLPAALNVAAMAELMAFEHVYGDNTLFAGVRLLRPGTILRFQHGNLSLRNYIDFQHPEYYEIHEEQYYIDAWIEYMRQAVGRQARGPAPLGVLLTGGLDSRSLLGMLVGNGIEVRTMTFGIPGCDDEVAARQMAHMLHVPHKFFRLPPDFLVHHGARAVRATDGMKSVVHTNMIGTLDDLVQESRILYKGFLGGTIHGYVVSHDRLAPVQDDVWFEYVFGDRNRVFAEREWDQLYTEEVYRQVCEIPRQSLRSALARSRSSWWVDKDSYVDLYEEDVRFTVLGVELARTQALVRTPLADKDMLRFAASVPPGFRVDKNYYRRAIVKAFPELSKAIYSSSRRPLNETCFRDLRMRFDEQTRWWLRDHGLKWVPVTHGHPYADYAAWMRRELRPWVEEVLLSPQSLDRGILRPAYVRNLVAEHMAGCDHARKISMLLTFELWHRQFLD